eukprot:XP_001703895.1 Hypothetical protein GL50803_135991 [Giardia lamblia ATCC 50803]
MGICLKETHRAVAALLATEGNPKHAGLIQRNVHSEELIDAKKRASSLHHPAEEYKSCYFLFKLSHST